MHGCTISRQKRGLAARKPDPRPGLDAWLPRSTRPVGVNQFRCRTDASGEIMEGDTKRAEFNQSYGLPRKSGVKTFQRTSPPAQNSSMVGKCWGRYFLLSGASFAAQRESPAG